MNNQILVIYDFKILYEILYEIKSHIKFKLLHIKKISDFDEKTNDDFLIVTEKKIKNIDCQMIINHFPINISKLIEGININFLKKKYNQQSEINFGKYKLNLNSRKIFNKEKSLDLTEREANIIIYLKNSKNPVKINKLQTEVWGHNSKLETHTVETHIYRLRKKIYKTFNDNNLIKSSKLGYSF